MEKAEQIVAWLRQRFDGKSAVIAVSGGVDSAVALTLLKMAIGKDRITPVSLPYRDQSIEDALTIVKFNQLADKLIILNIGELVDQMAKLVEAKEEIRRGNIMARMRMIVVFDLAKKHKALVCGTENKSEHELGYYTRFGDAASDVEPIASLYKTEVWEMAKALGLPEIFWTKAPSAGLWDGQTDEGEMGFSYQDADKVLQGKVEGMEPEVVERVRRMKEANKFKLEVPYMFDKVDVSAV